MQKIMLTMDVVDNFMVEEALKTLRTNIQFYGRDIHVIGITSTTENEGKSFVSLNVAHSFAELGKRVLLVDADMRLSVMANHSNIGRDVDGLSEVLAGVKSVNDCLNATQYENLHVMFAGHYPPNPSELLGSKYFAEMLHVARKMYDYIIVDTPPLGVVVDAALAATACDGMAIVVGDEKISYRRVREVVDQLKKSQCRILGVIRNNVDVEKKRYSHKYYGSYTKDLGKKGIFKK